MKKETVYFEDGFVDFIWQFGVDALVETFGQQDFLCDVRGRVVFEDGFDCQKPVVDVGPFGDGGEVLQGFLEELVEVLGYA